MPFNANCPGCGALDPCGCNNPHSDQIGSSEITYTGPPLPCTNIQTCDSLSVALQKIDAVICQILIAISPVPTTTTTTTTNI